MSSGCFFAAHKRLTSWRCMVPWTAASLSWVITSIQRRRQKSAVDSLEELEGQNAIRDTGVRLCHPQQGGWRLVTLYVKMTLISPYLGGPFEPEKASFHAIRDESRGGFTAVSYLPCYYSSMLLECSSRWWPRSRLLRSTSLTCDSGGAAPSLLQMDLI